MVEPTHLKNIRRLGSFPQVSRGENKKYLSCHQPGVGSINLKLENHQAE